MIQYLERTRHCSEQFPCNNTGRILDLDLQEALAIVLEGTLGLCQETWSPISLSERSGASLASPGPQSSHPARWWEVGDEEASVCMSSQSQVSCLGRYVVWDSEPARASATIPQNVCHHGPQARNKHVTYLPSLTEALVRSLPAQITWIHGSRPTASH